MLSVKINSGGPGGIRGSISLSGRPSVSSEVVIAGPTGAIAGQSADSLRQINSLCSSNPSTKNELIIENSSVSGTELRAQCKVTNINRKLLTYLNNLILTTSTRNHYAPNKPGLLTEGVTAFVDSAATSINNGLTTKLTEAGLADLKRQLTTYYSNATEAQKQELYEKFYIEPAALTNSSASEFISTPAFNWDAGVTPVQNLTAALNTSGMTVANSTSIANELVTTIASTNAVTSEKLTDNISALISGNYTQEDSSSWARQSSEIKTAVITQLANSSHNLSNNSMIEILTTLAIKGGISSADIADLGITSHELKTDLQTNMTSTERSGNTSLLDNQTSWQLGWTSALTSAWTSGFTTTAHTASSSFGNTSGDNPLGLPPLGTGTKYGENHTQTSAPFNDSDPRNDSSPIRSTSAAHNVSDPRNVSTSSRVTPRPRFALLANISVSKGPHDDENFDNRFKIVENEGTFDKALTTIRTGLAELAQVLGIDNPFTNYTNAELVIAIKDEYPNLMDDSGNFLYTTFQNALENAIRRERDVRKPATATSFLTTTKAVVVTTIVANASSAFANATGAFANATNTTNAEGSGGGLGVSEVTGIALAVAAVATAALVAARISTNRNKVVDTQHEDVKEKALKILNNIQDRENLDATEWAKLIRQATKDVAVLKLHREVVLKGGAAQLGNGDQQAQDEVSVDTPEEEFMQYLRENQDRLKEVISELTKEDEMRLDIGPHVWGNVVQVVD